MSVAETPANLRYYVLAVAVSGPLLCVVLVLAGAAPLSGLDLARAALLTALAAAVYGRSLRITHKFTYDFTEVAMMAMLLLFPFWLPGLLSLLAAAVNHIRTSEWGIVDLFNFGQRTGIVAVGALTLELLRHQDMLGPSVAGLPPIGAIVMAATTVILVNTGLIANVISLDAGGHFWRLWRSELVNITPAYATLSALGVVTALVIRDYPLALAPLVIPGFLVYHTLRREVQLRADERAALESLADMIELRDPYTAGHSERVARSARILAVRLGLSGDEADLIETAGHVHDLAKVAISEAVLNKQGPLDDAEWAEMKLHPVKGAEVIHRFAGYQECELLVRHHHEQWDGTGYPDGLAGEHIPLGARILAVADAFDALTSSRPYRSALGLERVLRILEEGAGTQWDPRVVETMVTYQREQAAPAPAAASQTVPA
jgi:hypothetical protein